MGGIGGIGAFGSGFMSGFQNSWRNRKLKEQFDIGQEQKAAREKRLSEQFDQTMEFRKDQASKLDEYRKQQLKSQAETRAAMEEYRAGQMDLEKKKIELQKQQLDVNTMGAWEKILDPKIGKPQRKFMFKQLATSLQIDPKSQQYKDFESMVTSMDDDNLKETYANLATLLPKANPGQVVAFSKAILSGQLQMKDAIEGFNKMQEQAQIAGITGGEADGGGAGGTDEQTGVPTKQVQSTRITDPTPMAQQKGVGADVTRRPGGTLPIPGMATPGGGEGDSAQSGPQPVEMTTDEARDKASKLLKLGSPAAREQAQALLQYARDKQDKFGLAVTVDENDPNNNTYTVYDKSDPTKALAGKEAPSSRNYPTPEEKAREAESVALAQADVKRLEPFREDANLARTVSGPLQTFKQTMDSGKFVTGSFAGTRETLARMADFVGLPDEAKDALAKAGITDAGSAELMDSTAAQVTSLLAERLGRVSNMQLGFVSQIGPQAWKTPKGNAMMIDLAEKQNQRALEIEGKIDEYMDAYGTMRPKGKPSVFQEINKIRAKPLVDDKWIDQFKAEGKRGQGLDWKSILDKAKGSETVKVGEDSYDIMGQSSWKDPKGKPLKQFPIIKLQSGDQLPYVGSISDFKKNKSQIPVGEPFLYLDPEEGLLRGHRE
jgi:hypothetical protein